MHLSVRLLKPLRLLELGVPPAWRLDPLSMHTEKLHLARRHRSRPELPPRTFNSFGFIQRPTPPCVAHKGSFQCRDLIRSSQQWRGGCAMAPILQISLKFTEANQLQVTLYVGSRVPELQAPLCFHHEALCC